MTNKSLIHFIEIAQRNVKIKKLLPLALALSFAGAAEATTSQMLVMKPFGQANAEFSTSFYALEGSKTTANTGVDLIQNDTTARFLLNPGQDNALTLGFESHHIQIDTSSGLLPRQLNNQSIAMGYDIGGSHIGMLKDWTFKSIVGVGFSGNKAFNDGDAVYFKGDLIGTKSIDDNSQWIVSLNYNGSRTFMPDVPLPTFAYAHQERKMQYMIGLPSSFINYNFNDHTSLYASGSLSSLNLKLTHKLNDNISLYASYKDSTQSFMIKAPSNHDRIIFRQTRVELGATLKLASSLKLTLGAGQAFDQEFEQGYEIHVILISSLN